MDITQIIPIEYEHIDKNVASIVQRLGNPVSTILLHEPCAVFQIPQIDGLIGYKQIGNCAVVIGDPICLPQDMPALAQAFHQYCHEHNLTSIYLLASDAFAHWAIRNGCHTLVQVADALSIDPMVFQIRQKLRWKINQSIQQGIVIKEYTHYDAKLEGQIKSSIQTWEQGRRGPQIHLGDLNFYLNGVKKRIFYAIRNEKIGGLIAISPIDYFEGWVVSSFFAIDDAPVGTTEHLITTVFDTLAREKCHLLYLGVVSAPTLGEIVGLSSTTQFFAHLVFKMAKWMFKLEAKGQYLNKFHPTSSPMYFLSNKKLTIRELLVLKQILNVKI